jgi:uncharacterized iron-regulated membrane protein
MRKKSTVSPYQTIWRWHFYACLIFAPFLLILAVTGSIYLFAPQIEQQLYTKYYEVEAQVEKIPASEQISEVKRLHPDAVITKFTPSDSPERSSEIGISTNAGSNGSIIMPTKPFAVGELSKSDVEALNGMAPNESSHHEVHH